MACQCRTTLAPPLHLPSPYTWGFLNVRFAGSPAWRSIMAPSLSLQVGTIFQPLLTYEMPPTYFRTDKVTHAFQEIVDAYGIARYR